MLLLTLFLATANAWNLHDVDHFCSHPPKVTESWIGSTFDDQEGVANTYPARWFPGTASVSLFESWSFNKVGVVVRASEVSTRLRKPFKQIERHYEPQVVDDVKTWWLVDGRRLPEMVIFLRDPADDVLILATCGKKRQ